MCLFYKPPKFNLSEIKSTMFYWLYVALFCGLEKIRQTLNLTSRLIYAIYTIHFLWNLCKHSVTLTASFSCNASFKNHMNHRYLPYFLKSGCLDLLSTISQTSIISEENLIFLVLMLSHSPNTNSCVWKITIILPLLVIKFSLVYNQNQESILKKYLYL